MRILVTGATGFLGAHLLRRLAGEEVQSAALLRPGTNPWRLVPLPANASVIEGDLRSLKGAEPVIRAFAPEVAVHAGWEGVAGRFRDDPGQDDNISQAESLFKMCAAAGCRHFIGLGSQAEYGPANKRLTEEDVPRPATRYGQAKLRTFERLQSLAASAGVRFAWLRVFSTYGPMEQPDWLIPHVINALLRQEKPLLTACEQRWDFLSAADAADAIRAVAGTEAAGVFNLASGEAHSLRSIVERIRDEIDHALPLGIGELPYRPDQVMHLEGDISKLTGACGWRPKTSLEEGLQETIAWHRKQQEQAA